MSGESRPRVLFAAGGTGGHVYPAIAIANEIRRMRSEAAIVFAGTRERMEWQAVPRAGYEIMPIAAAGLQRRATLQNLAVPLKVLRGFGQSLSAIRAFDPDVAVGTGGFVAGPVLTAARLLRRPILIQEQNAYPGITNRFLARLADEVHIAFPEAKGYLPADKCRLTGNPTRSEMVTADRTEGRRFFDLPEDEAVIFVFGGSLGSQALNEVLMEQAQHIINLGVQLLWQTGPRYHERVEKAVMRMSGSRRIRILSYVDRMDLAYAACDLVLCRSGAITCSELLVTGSPAVLVPSPNVAADHQTRNAESLVSVGAATMLPESRLRSELVPTLRGLLDNRDALVSMSAAARAAARPDAARQIAEAVLSLAAESTRVHSASRMEIRAEVGDG